jgi:hypothetical protein
VILAKKKRGKVLFFLFWLNDYTLSRRQYSKKPKDRLIKEIKYKKTVCCAISFVKSYGIYRVISRRVQPEKKEQINQKCIEKIENNSTRKKTRTTT